MTNYERIKLMSVEELKNLLNDITFYCRYDECNKCPFSFYKNDYWCGDEPIKKWLESEEEKCLI